jgi:GT2 family glycosyltransferase
MKKPYVCGIIVNWNRKEDIIKCIKSLKKINYDGFDILVVDNASADGSVEAIKKEFTDVEIMENKENLGGSGGFNKGISHALEKDKYDYLWLLDNDIIVSSESLNELLKAFSTDNKIAVAGSMILRMDQPETLQELGAYINDKEFKRVANLRDFPVSKISKKIIDVDYVAACSLLVDVKKLKKVGLMDTDYFLYFDDVEWCTRFKSAGYRVVAVSNSKIWHKEGGRNRKNNLPVYYIWRNKLYFFSLYCKRKGLEKKFVISYLTELYTALYITKLLNKINAHKTIILSVFDSLQKIRGKAKDNRLLEIDDNVFGKYFTNDFKEIIVIGENFDFYSQFENFIKKQKNQNTSVSYFYSGNIPEMSEFLLNKIKFFKINELKDYYKSEKHLILILNKHILSNPNKAEIDFADLLRKNDKNIYYLDQYSNFYKGYINLLKERKEYGVKLKLFLDIYSSILIEWMESL